MTISAFNLHMVHPSWVDCLQKGLNTIEPQYLDHLKKTSHWLPGKEKIFNAFSIPMNKVNYVLIGESPYPRKESANGYAFWDDAVENLWIETGLSKKVNRATSLRNIIKMLLIAEGLLDSKHTDQESIAKVDKSHLVQTNEEFFHNFINHGFLLLNATPVLQEGGAPQKDAKAWSPFTDEILTCLINKRPNVKFILFGRIAQTLEKFLQHHPHLQKLYAEHPYNVSFITNASVLNFFKPLHLLKKHKI